MDGNKTTLRSQSHIHSAPSMENDSANHSKSSLQKLATFLDNLYDVWSLCLCYADIITDYLVIAQWYYIGEITFWSIGVTWLGIAQFVYAITFVNLFFNESHHACTQFLFFLFFFPFAPCIALIIWVAFRNQHYIPSLASWVNHKSKSHFGFVLEAYSQALPMAIIQMIYIVEYQQPTLLNLISFILSILSICAKSITFSYAVDYYVFAFNFLCPFVDAFAIFTIFSWVLYDRNPFFMFNSDPSTLLAQPLAILNCVWILKILIVTLPTALNIVFYFLFGDSIKSTLTNMYIDVHIICGGVLSKILYPIILVFLLGMALILVLLATFMMETLSFTYIVWFGYSINSKLKEKHDLLYHLIPWIAKSLQIANEHKLKKLPENMMKEITKENDAEHHKLQIVSEPTTVQHIEREQQQQRNAAHFTDEEQKAADEISRDFKFRIYLSNFMMIPSEWSESDDEFFKINESKKLSKALHGFFKQYQSVILYLLYDKDSPKKQKLVSKLAQYLQLNTAPIRHHRVLSSQHNKQQQQQHRKHIQVQPNTAFMQVKQSLDISVASMHARWRIEAETSIWWLIALIYGKCFPVRKPSMHSQYKPELDNHSETRYWKFIGGRLLLPFYGISRFFSLIYPICAIAIWTSKEWDTLGGWSKFNNFQACLTVIYCCMLLIMLILSPKVWTYYFIVLHLPMAQCGNNNKNQYINVVSVRNMYSLLYQNAMIRIILQRFFGELHHDIMQYLEPDEELMHKINLLTAPDARLHAMCTDNVFDLEELERLHHSEILTEDQLKKYSSQVIFEESLSYKNYYADL